ncbi:abortive infection family protein [Rhizobium leguminosarum]|uniref:abortive infection family protein n=1 Tax=Rhizobium leguminosarum TaxID=384 RepID=UPI001C98BC23|nr:abortive infection family protein [Rhizobium leguminosarum]MBY5424839.1 abortive infection family protein [Rhizobium leguminosarum]
MEADARSFRLIACRELMASHPESLVISQQVEALEEALPDRPGVAVSFCRTLIETTCKTILIDRGQRPDDAWEAPKLIAETTKWLHLGIHDSGHTDPVLRSGAEKLLRGVNNIIDGVVEIRNAHGAAAHGSDAYAPMLDVRYAEIVARATDAVVGLLFKTHLNGSGKSVLARLRYGDHKDFNEWIDGDYGPFEVLETPLIASEALFRTDNSAYLAALSVFRQEQAAEAEADAAPVEIAQP